MIKFIHVSHHTDIYDVYVHINSFQITIGEMLIMTYKKKISHKVKVENYTLCSYRL